jgi:site-specific DNA-methyltransferase (adenine-specific)
MTRTQSCREKLSWIEENCPLDRTSIIPIRRAAELCDQYVEISTCSTDALQPLVKVKDTNIQENVVRSLKKIINAGGKPTRKKVEECINNAKMAPRREELVRRGKEVSSCSDTISLRHGDFFEKYTEIPAESIDCVITDPPYVAEWAHNYDAFAESAAYVLKPSGYLVTYMGQMHVFELHAALIRAGFVYYWPIALIQTAPNKKLLQVRNVVCDYKPILVMQKPPYSRGKTVFHDVIVGGGREKDAHEWQQGEEELRPLFEAFTNPGDLVLDPFMGSGTTLAMAKKLNRRAIGYDIVPENVDVVKGRIATVLECATA